MIVDPWGMTLEKKDHHHSHDLSESRTMALKTYDSRAIHLIKGRKNEESNV
ncbi:hypothetical protein JI667_15055 [Bacillus sp. NTK074B]|uniref:hypothetical protein n=1 Tax=Bacillus sp. NTK074B TaxID=2802174 RepID=UPI001A8DD820|nr:hypothetical protein [Bacillus sp. NTK074B]